MGPVHGAWRVQHRCAVCRCAARCGVVRRYILMVHAGIYFVVASWVGGYAAYKRVQRARPERVSHAPNPETNRRQSSKPPRPSAPIQRANLCLLLLLRNVAAGVAVLFSK